MTNKEIAQRLTAIQESIAALRSDVDILVSDKKNDKRIEVCLSSQELGELIIDSLQKVVAAKVQPNPNSQEDFVNKVAQSVTKVFSKE